MATSVPGKLLIVSFFILTVAVLSTAFGSGRKTTVLLQTGEQITGELLAARADVLVISKRPGLPEASLRSDSNEVTILWRKNINRITIPGKSWLMDGAILGLIGGIASWGVMASDPGRPPTGLDPVGPGEKGLLFFGLGGVALGILVGLTSSTEDRSVDVRVFSSLMYLKPFARYKDEEPDFLKKLIAASNK